MILVVKIAEPADFSLWKGYALEVLQRMIRAFWGLFRKYRNMPLLGDGDDMSSSVIIDRDYYYEEVKVGFAA
jgi:argininosuccinate lyase